MPPRKTSEGTPNFFSPGGCLSEPAATARFVFLVAARQAEPQLLGDLYRRVLPVYRQQAGQLGRISIFRDRRRAVRIEPHAPERRTAVHRVRSPLRQWARRWRICEPYILYHALETLYMWHVYNDEQERGVLRWASEWRTEAATSRSSVQAPVIYGTGQDSFLDPPPFRLDVQLPPWRLLEQQWTSWKKAANRVVRARLSEYRREMEELAKATGLERHTRLTNEQFEWLADYQVAGDEYWRIYEHKGRAQNVDSAAAVRRAVHRAAALLDLQLRPSRTRGRPARPAER